MTDSFSVPFSHLLKKLVLTPSTFTTSDVTTSFTLLASPSESPSHAQAGSFLTALRLTKKDHEAAVVAAAAEVLRQHSVQIDLAEGEGAGEGFVCDIVGTGGDGQNTFNVSTTAGIVAAGAGCRVYKHGNRASTSSSGSADILLSLHCPITTLPPSSIPRVCTTSSFLFLFAPLYHPTMARLAPVRKSLGFPTLFNLLGPLINPAKPHAMVVGVHSKALGGVFIEALKLLGVKSAWVVCGREGLDEISPEGETDVWQLRSSQMTQFVVSPSSFGLPSHALSTVAGGSPSENAATLDLLLAGKLADDHPVENFVVINTAALLFVAGKVDTLEEGVKVARESIENGGAKEALGRFRDAGQREVEK